MPSLSDFDARRIARTPETVPPGKYTAAIVDSALHPTRAGNGEYLELELEIQSGPWQGHRVWDRLTLKHPAERTVQIARAQLSAICRAAGVLNPGDSADLHQHPIQIIVGCRKREESGDIVNVVKGYEPCPDADRSAQPVPHCGQVA